MLEWVIPLIDKFFTGDVFSVFIVPVICLCFIACIPCILRYFVRR